MDKIHSLERRSTCLNYLSPCHYLWIRKQLVAAEEFIDPLRSAADFLWSLFNQVAHVLAVTVWSWIPANVFEFMTGLSNTITLMQLPNREAIEQVNSMVSIIVLGSTFRGIGVLIAASILKERMQYKKSSAIIG